MPDESRRFEEEKRVTPRTYTRSQSAYYVAEPGLYYFEGVGELQVIGTDVYLTISDDGYSVNETTGALFRARWTLVPEPVEEPDPQEPTGAPRYERADVFGTCQTCGGTCVMGCPFDQGDND